MSKFAILANYDATDVLDARAPVWYIDLVEVRVYQELRHMEYTGSSSLPEGRQRLTTLIGGAGDVISVDDAVRLLHLDRSTAAKTLARWTEQGWLRRVRRGAYVPVTLDTLDSEHVLDDPWVLVPSLFSPGYVGGRTAAEYWDLTEQIFNDIVVFTAKPVREKSQKHHGANFTVKHVAAERLFGTKAVWRGQSKVLVSDLQRTIVDMLDDPSIGGGIQHVADCLAEYLRRGDRNDAQLLAYIEQLGNGAVFKRLGFLAEDNASAEWLAEQCRSRLTKGNVKIDPSLDCPRMVTRWRLRIPDYWVQRGRA